MFLAITGLKRKNYKRLRNSAQNYIMERRIEENKHERREAKSYLYTENARGTDGRVLSDILSYLSLGEEGS
jgi:hypothetical protein